MSNHFDAQGQPHMVDVSAKPQTVRVAVAEGLVSMAAATLQAIRQTEIRKGDVLGVARLAAIGATKQTANLIPLCHAIPVEAVNVEFDFPSSGNVDAQQSAVGDSASGDSAMGQVRCQVTVRTTARTGVEMEALTAVAVAALTIYDMCKSIDRSMELGPIRLLNKSGGQSGDFQRASQGV
ncbi:cyclic pyranopterin monophosphate synthase MoaC [Planctomycetaceae bacterium SH139]